MDPSVAIQFIVLAILIVLSGVFSSAETATMTCNRIKMRSLEEEGNKTAALLNKILEDRSKLLSTLLIGNNIVNISASSIATVLATDLLGSSGAGVATGILTILILIFGEISPKTLATIHADKLSMIYCRPLAFLMKVLTPIIIVVNILAKGFLRMLRVDPDAKAAAMTEEELRTIVDVSHEDGVIEKDERNMIKNVVDFGDSQAKDIMVPRIDMALIDVEATYEELMEIFQKNMFTRFPVYEESVDNVIGIINMKDILLYSGETPFSLRNYLRKAYYTYEYKKTAELLTELRNANASIAIILDEYGTTAGLITIEDLVEEIVGDIRDEYDADEPDEFTKISDREYIVEGSAKLDDVNEKLELELESEDYDTIGGFVIGLLDHLPVVGEKAEFEGISFTVEQMTKKRVDAIRMVIPEAPAEDEDED